MLLRRSTRRVSGRSRSPWELLCAWKTDSRANRRIKQSNTEYRSDCATRRHGGIGSERGIAWRCADSTSLREWLGCGLSKNPPDRSGVSRTRRRLSLEARGGNVRSGAEAVAGLGVPSGTPETLSFGRSLGRAAPHREIRVVGRRDRGQGSRHAAGITAQPVSVPEVLDRSGPCSQRADPQAEGEWPPEGSLRSNGGARDTVACGYAHEAGGCGSC